MKKFLSGVFAGYALYSIEDAWRQGYFKRTKEVFASFDERTSRGEPPLSIKEAYQYITQASWPGSTSSSVTEEREAWVEKTTKEYAAKMPRIRAMHAEGYSNTDIADATDMPEDVVRIVLEDEERHFRIMLNQNQYEVVEYALRMWTANAV